MKAGAVSGGQTSSRESWLSAPLSDPNAALWASITPPANPDLATIVRRRAAAFSLDLLAQRLYLRFPAHFSSRSTARIAILAATVAFGAALGTAGYLGFIGPQQPATVAAGAAGPAPVPAALPAADDGTLANGTLASNAPARLGQTEVAAPQPATTLATTARSDATEQLAQPPLPMAGAAPRADAVDPSAAPAKAKRGATKKKRNLAAARRASKRRLRATAE